MKIAWLGGAPGHIGGQSRVAYHTLVELQKLGYAIVSAGVGNQCFDVGESAFCLHQPLDLRDTGNIVNWLNREAPDVLIYSHDLWRFYGVVEVRKQFPELLIIGWLTIDAHPLHPSWNQLLRSFDIIFTPSEFGRKVIYRTFPEKHIGVLSYGTDRNVFKSPESKIQAKADLIPYGITGLENRVVFTFAGANQFKKNIGVMVDAFSQLTRLPEAILILATKGSQMRTGGYEFIGEYDIPSLVFGMANIYQITDPLPDEILAKLYQASDFFLYPSIGESPGLQMAESQLCGCMPIATAYSGLVEESCVPELLLTNYVLLRGEFNCYRAVVDTDGLRRMMDLAIEYAKPQPGTGPSHLPDQWNFRQRVQEKFSNRSWANTAMELDETIQRFKGGKPFRDLTLNKVDL